MTDMSVQITLADVSEVTVNDFTVTLVVTGDSARMLRAVIPEVAPELLEPW